MAVSAVTDERPPLPAGLAGVDRLDAAEFLSPTRVPGVDLLDLSPLGGTPGDLTRATLKMVNALESRVDVIVIDTPPLAVTTEALEFVPVARVVVLIGRMGHTATAAAERAGELIRFGGAEQLAIALTDAGSGRLRRSNYYDYYRDQDQDRAAKASRRGSKSSRRKRESRPAPASVDAVVDPPSLPEGEYLETVPPAGREGTSDSTEPPRRS
jgi:Mrp family chromosome partitioning ATPase